MATPDPQAPAIERPTYAMNQDAVLGAMMNEVREVNETNGWFDEDRRPAEGLALLHSEVSEWLEAIRSRGTEDPTGMACSTDMDGTHLHDGPCKPEGVGSEAADVFIRLLDECDRQGIDLAWEYRRKIAYNRTCGYRHGGRSL